MKTRCEHRSLSWTGEMFLLTEQRRRGEREGLLLRRRPTDHGQEGWGHLARAPTEAGDPAEPTGPPRPRPGDSETGGG